MADTLRRLHMAFNVATRREGGTPRACDGPDCKICRYISGEALAALPAPDDDDVEPYLQRQGWRLVNELQPIIEGDDVKRGVIVRFLRSALVRGMRARAESAAFNAAREAAPPSGAAPDLTAIAARDDAKHWQPAYQAVIDRLPIAARVYLGDGEEDQRHAYMVGASDAIRELAAHAGATQELRDDDPIRIALEDLNLHCTDHVPDPDCEGCRTQLAGFVFTGGKE